jgi:hypothetical protein
LYGLLLTAGSCTFTSPGEFRELSRQYSPDSSRYILRYAREQGAWDGGRTFTATIMNRHDPVVPDRMPWSLLSHSFDDLYWVNADTVAVVGSFTEYLSQGKADLRDTVVNGVAIRVIYKDPIDTSFTKKVVHASVSPDGKQALAVYRYVKPENGDYFLNVSVYPAGDPMPRFGNFYVSRYGFDCISAIRWDSANSLDIRANSGCYYAFSDYLVKNRQPVRYRVSVQKDGEGSSL